MHKFELESDHTKFWYKFPQIIVIDLRLCKNEYCQRIKIGSVGKIFVFGFHFIDFEP